MTLDQVFSLLCEEISGARAKDYVARIATHHRIQGSPGFLDALTDIKDSLTQMEISHKVHVYPADGKQKTFSWQAPLAWYVRGGSLRQLTPEQHPLIRFEEIPQGIIAQSQAGSVEAELIDVGEGISPEDYERENVRGKFVMATGRPQEVAPLAVQYGAVGVILYPTSERAGQRPNLIQYAGFWPDASQRDTTPLGFSISRRQADALLTAMRDGPVRLVGSVDADLGPGSLHVLEGWLPGRNPGAKEILLIAHLCHPRPSANDNASGSGLLLEIARALTALAQARKLLLERSVRFLWVPEFYGTLPWVNAHREQVDKLLFVLNLDMVGQSPDKLGEPFHVWQVPTSIPSYLNAWFEPLLERIADNRSTIAPGGTDRPMQWRLDPASGGSDHIVFTDPLFCIPAVMFGHEDPLHHSHLDDLDMVDPTELKRVGILTAALTLLPGLMDEELSRITGWLLRYSLRELTRAFELSIGKPAQTVTDLLTLALHIETKRAASLKRLLDEISLPWSDKGHHDALSAACKGLPAHFDTPPGNKLEGFTQGEQRTPQKAFAGPFPYSALRSFSKADRQFMEKTFFGPYGAIALEALNLCDGTRSIREIALQLSLEFHQWISTDTLTHALEISQTGGWVTL